MDLETIIREAKDLPSTPQILPKLQSVLRDEDSQVDDIITVIKVDAPLTAQILKVSNSVFFGGVTPSQNLNEAVNRLGYQEIYKVVGTAVAKQALNDELPAYKMAPGELWERSVVSAVMMEVAARHLRICPDTAYTIGLLHSIGKLVVNNFYLKNGIELYGEEEGEDLAPEMEKQILGFNHAEAGAALLQNWDFSESIYTPIQTQLTPLEAEEHRKMACMIHLAAWCSNWLGVDTQIDTTDLTKKMSVIEAVGFSEDDFKELLFTAKENLERIQGEMKV